MAIISFVIVASFGLLITVLAISREKRRGPVIPHRHAAILALGLGGTWLVSFFTSFMVPSIRVKIADGLALFGVVNSTIVAMMTYGIVRFYYAMRSRDG